jgi:hypothetical protein
VTLLVAGLIRFLVLVFFEVSLLAVVTVMRVVILAFAHPLLVSFVFRIVLVVILIMVLQNWSRHGLCIQRTAWNQFSLRRPRRSNGSVERTGGQAGYLIDLALDREASLGSGESTRTTRNGVDFGNAGDTGCRRRLTRSGNCRIDAVSIGRNQLTRPCCGAVR